MHISNEHLCQRNVSVPFCKYRHRHGKTPYNSCFRARIVSPKLQDRVKSLCLNSSCWFLLQKRYCRSRHTHQSSCIVNGVSCQLPQLLVELFIFRSAMIVIWPVPLFVLYFAKERNINNCDDHCLCKYLLCYAST